MELLASKFKCYCLASEEFLFDQVALRGSVYDPTNGGGAALPDLIFSWRPIFDQVASPVELRQRAGRCASIQPGGRTRLPVWGGSAPPQPLPRRKLTCAHNFVCDIDSAGGEVAYFEGRTAGFWVGCNHVTGKHPTGWRSSWQRSSRNSRRSRSGTDRDSPPQNRRP